MPKSRVSRAGMKAMTWEDPQMRRGPSGFAVAASPRIQVLLTNMPAVLKAVQAITLRAYLTLPLSRYGQMALATKAGPMLASATSPTGTPLGSSACAEVSTTTYRALFRSPSRKKAREKRTMGFGCRSPCSVARGLDQKWPLAEVGGARSPEGLPPLTSPSRLVSVDPEPVAVVRIVDRGIGRSRLVAINGGTLGQGT